MDSLDDVFDYYMPGDPPPAGVVWPWAGPTHADGYGVLQCQHEFWLAHRYSYQRFVGPIPPGAVVRHRNDTPIDVNPNNLELGSQADNVADMHERGRARKARPVGEMNAGHKLTDAEVRKIRNLRNNHGWKLRELSERFGVGESAVSAIARQKTWRHLE
ncbi:HNH endonuclease [uncultured Williamsia sp.]|uniref:HNH endonuclease n=1 Tax=uncultured Williamsia sp. TaxID=259311 RepID=UPI00261B699F|nr:HNH endonuclease [uncultured Williamsia sp.]